MPYLLDSDQCIYALAREPETVTLMEHLLADGCAISVITYMEVYQGIIRTLEPHRSQVQLQQFLRGIRTIPITVEIAERCALLRQLLKAQGKRVNSRALDLLNAATALTYDLTLVTRNTVDYDDIPALSLYAWTEHPR